MKMRPALCLFRRATQIRGAATNVSKALEQGLLEDAASVHDTHGQGAIKFWLYATIAAAIPLGLAWRNAQHHIEEEDHEERAPYKAFQFTQNRTRPFPWGDGNHSLFHNPYRNALPGGYETPDGPPPFMWNPLFWWKFSH